MADLRLVGVHEDGEHLLLSGTGGEIFMLPIDEALRQSTQRSSLRPASAGSPGEHLSPRDIQAKIRHGASAAEVAAQSGLTLEHILRYEGPVMAEREYIAQQARKVEVAPATTGSESYRSAFGEGAVSLGDMVAHRLRAFGIDTETLRWDAWRATDGTWTVIADFEPGTLRAASSIGEPTPARWTFHAGRKTLFNANRWAQQLSELEPLDGPVPERRLSAVADRPFDFETDRSAASSSDVPSSGVSGDQDELSGYPAGASNVGTREAGTREAGADGAGEETGGPESARDGLLDMLRSRRGVRLGVDEGGDEELATLLGSQLNASEPSADEDLLQEHSDGDRSASTNHSDANASGNSTEGKAHGKNRLRAIPFLSLAPRHHSHDEDPPFSVGEVSTDTTEITLSGEPSLRHPAVSRSPVATAPGLPQLSDSDEITAGKAVGEDVHKDDQSESDSAARLERKATARAKRSSVPSWDEIVFGTKGD